MKTPWLAALCGAIAFVAASWPPGSPALAETAAAQPAIPVTHYKTETIDGLDVFYREAGPKEGPVVLLLHGFPTSSHMFRNLIPLLADHYRVIAPDYPGFGNSAMPDHSQYAYTFANYAKVVDGLMERLGASRYAIYVMDYGAPVGFRMALQHPDRISAMIVQNGNAYDEGLAAFWDPIKAYWAENTPARRAALNVLMQPATTKFQYVDGVSDPSRIDPDNWLHDQVLLDRPGNLDIQLDLFRDYGTNVTLYPQFQAFFRERRPPTLIVWGANDKIFPASGAHPFRRDLPGAEFPPSRHRALRARGQAGRDGAADPRFPGSFVGHTLAGRPRARDGQHPSDDRDAGGAGVAASGAGTWVGTWRVAPPGLAPSSTALVLPILMGRGLLQVPTASSD